MRKTLQPITFLAFMVFCACKAVSQSIQGTVLGEKNAPLAGANVVIKEVNSGQVTDLSGNFTFTHLNPGQYTLQVSHLGYELKIRKINISGNKTYTVTISLIPEPIQLVDVLISSTTGQPMNLLSPIDIKLRPVNTSQDVLRMVPGLFIAQHAGGGKAEQIFLRGFDCDHGTDINVQVDDLPVNMVSHAHGQGYADLHFLMPELINRIDFDKGPYYADKGDFNTAGYVDFQTKDKLDRNFVKMEGGSFYTGRLAAGINVLGSKKSNAYFGGEIFKTDGYFDNKQNFTRFNFQGRFNSGLSPRTTFTGTFTAFGSRWDASGQIPDRAVDNGSISRFGSIDPTEGGSTGRFNAYAKLVHKLPNGATLENIIYAIRYDFNLYSNFTFFLNDPQSGDQINQRDNRMLYGTKSRYQHTSAFLGKTLTTDLGIGTRYDVSKNIALNHTVKREFLNPIKLGDVKEFNLHAFLSESLSLTEKFSVNAACRFDYFNFYYLDKLNPSLPRVGKSIVNPKLNFHYQLNKNIGLFLRTGTGFHSNDARVVVAQAGKEILPRAYSMDLGTHWKVTSHLLLHLALWRLDMEQEFVYVGDEGVVEPGGKTTRQGIDLSARYQLNSWLFADLDMNFTQPRYKDLAKKENHIPLSPVFTSIAGLTIRKGQGFNGSLRYRFMSDRPANEDNTLVAAGYFITDAVVNYQQKTWEVGLSVENLFNSPWKEAQFATLSRLKEEENPVEEIHYTPGSPFSFRIRLTRYF